MNNKSLKHDDYNAQLKAGHIHPELNLWDNNDFSSEINLDSDDRETGIEIEPHIDETSLQAIIDNNEMISIDTNRIRAWITCSSFDWLDSVTSSSSSELSSISVAQI
jgi:hypothetical protein